MENPPTKATTLVMINQMLSEVTDQEGLNYMAKFKFLDVRLQIDTTILMAKVYSVERKREEYHTLGAYLLNAKAI